MGFFAKVSGPSVCELPQAQNGAAQAGELNHAQTRHVCFARLDELDEETKREITGKKQSEHPAVRSGLSASRIHRERDCEEHEESDLVELRRVAWSVAEINGPWQRGVHAM